MKGELGMPGRAGSRGLPGKMVLNRLCFGYSTSTSSDTIMHLIILCVYMIVLLFLLTS